MILQKSRQECKDFYEVLDYYLELIRKLHKRTYASLAEKLASTNPIQFMQGGLLNGNLKANEKIGELLRPMTMSFGVTALNELQVLYNGKSIYEDGEFALEVMKYINKKINEFKEEDNILYACYGTPAEQLCLAPDTEVQTYEGIKMIKDITTNDLVYSFNEKLHKIELKRVLFAGKTGINRQVIRVTMDNGQTVVCTPNHPFAVVNNKENITYIEAESLNTGMIIKSNKLDVKVLKIELLSDLIDVYDITVEDNHNFFIGGSNGILVHNCGLQIEQFRAKYGVINGVSSREYVSNSFHCGVWEDITPIEKQDSENRFWDLFNGGKIQYCRYPINYNTEAMKTLVRRAMSYGFYEGINEQLSYCDDCGHEELEMTEKCSSCGSENLTIEDRMNGYIGYTKVKGKPRFNKAKLIEIKERKSM